MNHERLIGTAKRLDKVLKVVQIVNNVGGITYFQIRSRITAVIR